MGSNNSHHDINLNTTDIPNDKEFINEWKESCKEKFRNFYYHLGNRIWDKFDYPAHDQHLLQKIAIPLFGKPMDENLSLDLTDEQKTLVHEIRDKCITHSVDASQIRMAVIFVFVYVDKNYQSILPVFRIISHSGETFDNIPDNIFIDHLGRVYENWAKYKAENTLNMARLCVPENGYYASQSNYEFLDQSSRGQLLNTLDHYSTASNIATGLVMVVGILLSFFPPTAPIGATVILGSTIAGAPGAIYGVERSVNQLVDRARHEQSISLADSEARQCWLLTASSLLSIGPMAAGKALAMGAEGGRVASALTRAVVTTLNVTTSTVAGLGIINSIYELAHKNEITSLDIVQLTTSIFFFSHSLVTAKTASSMIRNAQERQLTKMRNGLSSEQQAIHDALLRGTKEVVEHGKVREMHGRAQFIREMKKIDNVDEFYSHFGIKTDGQLYINSELTIHPKAFLQMSEADRLSMLNLSRRLKDNEITLPQFNREAAPIQKEYRLRLDRQRVDAEIYLKKHFAVEDLADIELGGNRLGALKPAEIDRLEQVVKNSFHNGDREFLQLADKFAQKQGVSNLTEYCAAGEYAVRKVELEVTKRRTGNPNPSRPPGIKAKDFYKSQVVAEILGDESKMNEMHDTFNQLRAEVDAVNTGHPKFNNSMAAANHYDKHPFFPKVDPVNNLSCESYFNIATEMAGGPVTDIKWTQDGSTLKCTFISEKYGATAIRYDNLANRTSVIATLMATDVNEIRLINPTTSN